MDGFRLGMVSRIGNKSRQAEHWCLPRHVPQAEASRQSRYHRIMPSEYEGQSSISAPVGSVVELSGDLELPGPARGCDLAEAGTPEARVGVAPLRSVGYAVSLQPQLQVLLFRYVEVLGERDVLIHDRRPAVTGQR